MLNYETLLSSYDDRLTLMQWLKKVEDALKDASAVSFDVVNYGNATLAFKIDFADGTSIESDKFVLQKGDSVESAAFVNGHLILTLTNGEEIDAGDLLGGNVNIGGNLDITGNVFARGDIYAQGDIETEGNIQAGAITAETLSQSTANATAAFTMQHGDASSVENVYNRFIVVNGILHIVAVTKFTNTTASDIVFYTAGSNWISTPSPDKIVDVDGYPVSEAHNANIAVARIYGMTSATQNDNMAVGNLVYKNISTANISTIFFRFDSGLRIPANSSVYVVGRLDLVVL